MFTALLFGLVGLAALALLGSGQAPAPGSAPAQPPAEPPPITPELLDALTELWELPGGGFVRAFKQEVIDAIGANLGFCSLHLPASVPNALSGLSVFEVHQPATADGIFARDAVLKAETEGLAVLTTPNMSMPLARGRLLAIVSADQIGLYASPGALAQMVVFLAPPGSVKAKVTPFEDTGLRAEGEARRAPPPIVTRPGEPIDVHTVEPLMAKPEREAVGWNAGMSGEPFAAALAAAVTGDWGKIPPGIHDIVATDPSGDPTIDAAQVGCSCAADSLAPGRKCGC